MSKIGSWLLLILALFMISTVTIWGPERITQDVLSKIVPERKTQQDKDVVVRLKLDKPFLPGEDVELKIGKMADLAGNQTRDDRTFAATAEIESDDTTPPRLVDGIVMADPAKGEVKVVAVFSEKLRKEGAEAAASYIVEAPAGNGLSLQPLPYDVQARGGRVVVLKGKAKVKVGDSFALKIVKGAAIQDLAGNQIDVLPRDEGAKGKVVEWREELTQVVKAVQDLDADATGRTVAVTFGRPLAAAVANERGHYRTGAGTKAESSALGSDGRTVQVKFTNPVVPGETQLNIEGLKEADNGVPIPFCPDVAIQPQKTDTPKAASLRVEAVAGDENDVAVVTFDQNVIAGDATNLENYTLKIVSNPFQGASVEEQIAVMAVPLVLSQSPANIGPFACVVTYLLAPQSTDVELSACAAEYDEQGHAVTITVKGVDLAPGDSCVLTCSNIRNIAGNPMADVQELSGRVGGDTERPTITKVVQDLSQDSTGATLLVRFAEAVDMETADQPEIYKLSGEKMETVLTRTKGGDGVYVLVSQPVIPDDTTVSISGVRDIAGNVMDDAKGVRVTPQETNPPTITRLRGVAIKDVANDTITVGFSEALVPGDATDPSNYALEVPKGKSRNLAGAELVYDSVDRAVKITLAGIGEEAVNLKKGEALVLRVSNVRDLAGNPIVTTTQEGIVEGDSSPPGIRHAFLNNVVAGKDKKNRIVDLYFSEAVDPEAASKLESYTVLKGPAVASVKALGDGEAVRVTFDGPVATGRGNYGFLIVAIVVAMCYMILESLTKDLGATTRNVLRAIVLVVVVAAIVLSLTSPNQAVRLKGYGITDLAGNPARALTMPPIGAIEKEPPRVAEVSVVRPPEETGLPTEVILTFSEPLDPQDAVDRKHYTFKSPLNTTHSLASAKLQYVPSAQAVKILLSLADAPVRVGDPFVVSVSDVMDLAGNKAETAGAHEGAIGGDLEPPSVVGALHRWEELDLIDFREEVEEQAKIKGYGAKVGKGKVADIDFSEPLDPVTAEDANNYLIFGGARTVAALLDEDDPKKVWVAFGQALVPGETKILLRNLRDLAGNRMPVKTDLTVASEEQEPPKVIRSQANAVSGVENDTVFVTFDEQIVGGDATKVDNYTVESPPGTAIDLTGCKITYNAPTSTTTITLTKDVNLKTTQGYKVTVSNVRDVSGNKITENGEDNVIEGSIRGDRSKPLARMVKVTQRLSKDPSGRTIDITFEEAIDPAIAEKPENYTTSAGHKIESIEITSVEKEKDEALLEAVEKIDREAIKRHMAAFAAMPTSSPRKSRMSGTRGNVEAKDYIVKQLSEMGLDPKEDTLKVVVPIEKLATMTALSSDKKTFNLAAVWPNKVKTCSLPKEGLRGRLIDGGQGELHEYNGKPMAGSIVMLGFGSGMNYFNARTLGASCILFYDDGNVEAGQAVDKFIEVPADIPRFWVDKADVPQLKELAAGKTEVQIKAHVVWEERNTSNIYACLEGADDFMPPRGDEEPRKWKDQIVVIEAYYDSISVVPELAPGADAASGIATMLELAKFLTTVYPPKYSILFVATSGHFQGMSGASDFAYRHIRKSDYYLERMAAKDKIEYLFYKDTVGRLPETADIETLEEDEVLHVKLATRADAKAGKAIHLWGSGDDEKFAMLDEQGKLVVVHDEKEAEDTEKVGEIRKMAMRLFVGLDLSTHNNQVASFAEGTFFNYGWRTDNYKQNALAPFGKKFFEYYEDAFPPAAAWEAKAKTRDITYLETRRYINAVTPSKRSWRHYMHAPLGLDHECVTWVGHFAISMATPQDMRKLVDTPNDTMEAVGEEGVDNVYEQACTLAALFGQAGRDDEFIPDSKLELKDLGHNMKGNVVWFDRNVNFFVPKSPIPGAIMTYQLSSDRSRSGVRTLMCAMTASDSPHGGDERKGWRAETITADTTRIRVKAWNRDAKGDPKNKHIVIRTRYGTFKYEMEPDKDEKGVWTTGQVDLTRKVHRYTALIAPGIICGLIALLCLGLVYFIKEIPKPAAYICYTTAGIVAAIFFAWTTKVIITKHNDPRLEPKQENLNLAWDFAEMTELKLGDDEKCLTVSKAQDVGFGKYEGQFMYDIRRHRWTIWPFGYKLNDEGDIVFAADRGQEGDKTYPIPSHYGWWETNVLQVLFPCRAMSVFDTVDSRYLTALDYSTMLGPDDAVPQWWGIDQVLHQSRREGKTVEVAVFYAKPGQRVKVLMSTGLFGVKYLLTNAPEELFTHKAMVTPGNVSGTFGEFYDEVYRDTPEQDRPSILDREHKTPIKLMARGRGYPIETGIILNPAYKGTQDMWIVDDVRMKELAKYGVENEKISHLHDRAKAALELAQKHLDNQEYDRFMAAAREAWGLEARGYPDVKKTANDTVKGIVFYFILLLPFSYFAERLLFGFADVRKRLIAFAIIFVVVFLILHVVHPAFKLSSSPYIIFLAFITFALGGIVLFMVMAKFNEEVQKIKRAAAGIHEVDVGRMSATYAAINLGISNLRKRKIRTTLTAATLILLTFTVLSFTSVSASLKYYKLPRDNRPTYQGSLVRDRNWKGLQESVLRYLESAFEGKAEIIPRSWKMARLSTEKQYIRVEKVGTEKVTFPNALVGLTEKETVATRVDQYLIGENSRWFKQGDRNVCILPNDMAGLVGITEDDLQENEDENPQIRMLGEEFRVVGILDSDRFNRTRDLDDEKLTPVDMVSEGQRMRSGQREDPDLQASEPIESFVHLESSNVLLVPHDYVMAVGGTLRSVAITRFKDPKIGRQVEEFMSRVALTVFVGERDSVTVYSSIGATSLGGLANLAIPILIAALIVLNTMLGSVYERFREIGIFSSVGLAPSHIAALFLAEAAVFATIGAVMGYLIGQVATMCLSQFDLLSGMNLNYSSLSAISSTLVVMATVFLSTIYPAKKAASMAVPDVTRKWKFPEPEGDRWIFDFPFTIGGAEVVGMYAYLARIFESYGEGSTGGFVAENVQLASGEHPDGQKYTITMRTWLAPYDLGISQDVTLDGLPTGEHNVYRVEVILQRLSGDVASWRRINRGFLNVLRKRFLVWRTVSPEEKVDYREQGQSILEEASAAG